VNLPAFLAVELLSDTTFGRGQGTAGVVDVEVEHDADGLPLVRGKTLHGLLRDAWLSMSVHFTDLSDAAARILGVEADLSDAAVLRVGDGLLPADVRAWVRHAVRRPDKQHPLRPDQVLASLTDVRRQTARSRLTGAPEETTLRSSRVVLRGLTFDAPLAWLGAPTVEQVRLLALCTLGVRHGGLGRNRGRGLLRLTIDGNLELTRNLAGVGKDRPRRQGGKP
jgi:hypothetical protein